MSEAKDTERRMISISILSMAHSLIAFAIRVVAFCQHRKMHLPANSMMN